MGGLLACTFAKKKIPSFFAGNKSDMEKNRTVDQMTAEAYATSVGAVHFNTSAKLNKGIDDMFLELTKRWFLFIFLFVL